MRALLVEDEALVALIAEEVLDSLGFAVTVAGSGAEARAALPDGFDVAIIDVGLPDERGDDFAKYVRTAHPDLAILMASGYDPSETAALFGDDPKLVAIGKPYTEGDLAGALRRLGLNVGT